MSTLAEIGKGAIPCNRLKHVLVTARKDNQYIPVGCFPPTTDLDSLREQFPDKLSRVHIKVTSCGHQQLCSRGDASNIVSAIESDELSGSGYCSR